MMKLIFAVFCTALKLQVSVNSGVFGRVVQQSGIGAGKAEPGGCCILSSVETSNNC